MPCPRPTLPLLFFKFDGIKTFLFCFTLRGSETAYPHEGQPFTNSSLEPILPHCGHRTDAKNLPHLGQDFEFLVTTVSSVWVMEDGKIKENIAMREENKSLILKKMMGGDIFE